jgi:hypothetical protein
MMMKLWKLILGLLVVVFGVYLGFMLLGLVYTVLWYLIAVAILGGIGYGAYRLMSADDPKQLGEKSVSQIELDNAKIVRDLEEYKRKSRS